MEWIASNLVYKQGGFVLAVLISALVAAGSTRSIAQPAKSSPPAIEIRVLEVQGYVDVFSKGGTAWSPASTNLILHPQDRLRAASNSRVVLRWSDESIVSFGASTELEILPPDSPQEQAGLHLVRGIISFFHRDQPGHIHVITRGAAAGVEGTEFALAVDDADNSVLSVIDGRVRFGNALATLVLTNGEQAIAALGAPPVRTPGFIANNILQWCFYYPGVLDPDELQLTAAEQSTLAESLTAYRSGDLLAALEKFPRSVAGPSERVQIYHAAVLLSVGEVAEAQNILSASTDPSSRPGKLAAALRQVVAAVKRQPPASGANPELASELLANSYYEQSRAVGEASLRGALRLARQAAQVAPNFGFAWERVAELEFSFGKTDEALKALEKSLWLSPRNAQALALKGFVLAARHQQPEALEWFNRAMAADAALGNAWLGRGLVRIHRGDKTGGRSDLLVAAALEPQRAELRSYLGKAYAFTGDQPRAARELAQAKTLDKNDPTAWLYSALLNQQQNQINDAIRDLEHSQELNNNRSVYRSQLLLDQDQATRSANLAGVYRDAGMFDQSLREGQRAVSTDYANYSAHLFLANSYDQLRDPNWANLRYEAPANAEYWIANLLAPASAGWMSSVASEQPYTKLFDQNRMGVVSDTTYLGRGAWTQLGAQFGTYDNFTYSVQAKYTTDPGQYKNNDETHRDLTFSGKYQLTPKDSIFFSIEQNKITGGDINQYYQDYYSHYPTNKVPQHFIENQEPDVFAGYHHEWAPGLHTLLFVASSTADDYAYSPNVNHWLAATYNGPYNAVRSVPDRDLITISTREYSAELQQIWETGSHTTIAGARYSWGDFHFKDVEWYPMNYAELFVGRLGSEDPNPKHKFEIVNDNLIDNYSHLSFYGYHDWQVLDWMKLFAGVSYDRLEQPAVVDTVPFSRLEKTQSQTSPKAGFILTPWKGGVVRGAYTRSLSGLIDDSSLRIEPTEVAGFNQAYRSIIPDTVAGDTSGAKNDAYDIAFEQKFPTGTYLAIGGEFLNSSLLKYEGSFYFDSSDDATQVYPYTYFLRENLDYREKTLTLDVDQLLGKQWAVGARYRISQANLDINYLDIPGKLPKSNYDAPFRPRASLESLLQTVNVHANWNHPSGLFGILEANWYAQDNLGFAPAEPGDEFWQLNARVGYRFWHRKAEVSLGVLNITEQNYRLEPLNLYNEMPRSRTLYARLLLSF